MALPSIPNFSLRWTEPSGRLGKTEHTLEVQVAEHGGKRAPTGAITATSAEQIGPFPSGGLTSTSRFINDESSWRMANDLWRSVRGSAIHKWVPAQQAPGGKLDRNDMELVVKRGKETFEVYRADLGKGAQPLHDVIAAASGVVGALRTDDRSKGIPSYQQPPTPPAPEPQPAPAPIEGA